MTDDTKPQATESRGVMPKKYWVAGQLRDLPSPQPSHAPGFTVAPTPSGEQAENNEKRWRAALEHDWSTLCQRVGPTVSAATATQTAESIWKFLLYIDQWRAWFEQYSAPAIQLERAGLPALKNRLDHIQTQLNHLTDSYWKSFEHHAAEDKQSAAPAPVKPAPDIAEILRKSDADMQKMRDAEFESTKKFWDGHNQRWMDRFAKSGPDVWRGVADFQRSADRMWARVLSRRR